MGVDELGVDEMGVDEMGSRRSGNKPDFTVDPGYFFHKCKSFVNLIISVSFSHYHGTLLCNKFAIQTQRRPNSTLP